MTLEGKTKRLTPFISVRPVTNSMQLKRSGLDRILRLYFKGFLFLNENVDDSVPLAGTAMITLQGITVFASIYKYVANNKPSEYFIPYFVDGDFFTHPRAMMDLLVERFDGWCIEQKPSKNKPFILRRSNKGYHDESVFVAFEWLPFAFKTSEDSALWATLEKIIQINNQERHGTPC